MLIRSLEGCHKILDVYITISALQQVLQIDPYVKFEAPTKYITSIYNRNHHSNISIIFVRKGHLKIAACSGKK